MLVRTHTPKADVIGHTLPHILRFGYFTPEQLEENNRIRFLVRNRQGEVIWAREADVVRIRPYMVGGIKHSNGRNDNIRIILPQHLRLNLELQGVLEA